MEIKMDFMKKIVVSLGLGLLSQNIFADVNPTVQLETTPPPFEGPLSVNQTPPILMPAPTAPAPAENKPVTTSQASQPETTVVVNNSDPLNAISDSGDPDFSDETQAPTDLTASQENVAPEITTAPVVQAQAAPAPTTEAVAAPTTEAEASQTTPAAAPTIQAAPTPTTQASATPPAQTPTGRVAQTQAVPTSTAQAATPTAQAPITVHVSSVPVPGGILTNETKLATTENSTMATPARVRPAPPSNPDFIPPEN